MHRARSTCRADDTKHNHHGFQISNSKTKKSAASTPPFGVVTATTDLDFTPYAVLPPCAMLQKGYNYCYELRSRCRGRHLMRFGGGEEGRGE